MKHDLYPRLEEPFTLLEQWEKNYILFKENNHTVSSYSGIIRRYAGWIGGVDKCVHSRRQDILDWLSHLKVDRQTGASHRNQTLFALRNFFGYLIQEGILDRDPTTGLKAADVGERRSHALSESQLLRAEVTIRKRRSGPQGDLLSVRDKVLCKVLTSTGMRRSEVSNFCISHINFVEKYIRVIGKGNKERFVFFDPACEEALHVWLDMRPKSTYDNVFVTATGNPISPRNVWKIVKQDLRAAGLKGSTHTLRHSFATELNNNGTPVEVLQLILGHSSLATTQQYIHIQPERLRESYLKSRGRMH